MTMPAKIISAVLVATIFVSNPTFAVSFPSTNALATQSIFKLMVTITEVDGKFVIFDDEKSMRKMQQGFRRDAEGEYINHLRKRAEGLGLTSAGLKQLVFEHFRGISFFKDDGEQQWINFNRPGNFHDEKKEILDEFDKQHGPRNWRVAWKLGDKFITQAEAFQVYEDAYYEYLKKHPEIVEYLVNNASDVYDNALSNVESGFDYNIQESESTHLQDIALRRIIILRLGKKFRGNKLIQIRSTSEDEIGRMLSPGKGEVYLHVPELIESTTSKHWWKDGTVEDWFQQNLWIQVTKTSLKMKAESRIIPTAESAPGYSKESQQGQTFIDMALIRASEAKRLYKEGRIENPNILIGLEAGLIPERQRSYFQGIINELRRLKKQKGLDNLIIEDCEGENLASIILHKASETGVPNSNIIFIGRASILDLAAFDPFREDKDLNNWAFFVGVELPKNFPENNYIRLLEMLTKAVNLWAGNPKPADTQFMRIVQEGKHIYRFIIPEIEPMDYNLLQKIYAGQLKAMKAA